MTLDEAIRHAEEKAEELENQCDLWKRLADERGLSLVSDYEPCKKCAEEHRQLAEWLKELKRVRELPWLKELKELREQKRPHGEWKYESYGQYLSTYKCSNCGFHGDKQWICCPYCGADMRKEGDPNG